MSTDDSSSSLYLRHFLLLLLAADAVFVLVHLVNESTGLLGSRLYALDRDRGFAEVFQYIKLYWATILLMLLWWRTRAFVFLAWAAVFGYLLLDDALHIHERGGEVIAAAFNYAPFLRLRGVDFGELTVTVLAGLFLLALLALGVVRSGADGQEASKDLGALLALLVLFGVVFDMLHQMVGESPLDRLFVIAEDGGEMIVVSFACWYAAGLLLRDGRVPSPLWRAAMRRRRGANAFRPAQAGLRG